MTTIDPPVEPTTVTEQPEPRVCPLVAKQCTVDECYNLNDPDAQARCNLC